MPTQLLTQILACKHCEEFLPNPARPILQFNPKAKILIAGQAPGRKAHESGIPFDDASGDRLREWMGISREIFYDPEKIAILPLGFCYPGTAKSGDLPPRAECAIAWRSQLLSQLQQLQITLHIGQYAQQYHFMKPKKSLTERVKLWTLHQTNQIPLPHPSPRNNIWLKRNEWFETELLPELKKRIAAVIDNNSHIT